MIIFILLIKISTSDLNYESYAKADLFDVFTHKRKTDRY